MARKQAKPPAAESRVSVVAHERKDARRVITFHPNAIVWTKPEKIAAFNAALQGAIVRVYPPAHVTDEDITRVVDAIRKLAEVVRLMPKPVGPAVILGSEREIEKRSARTPRELVEEMVEQANTTDRQALRALVGKKMDEAGL